MKGYLYHVFYAFLIAIVFIFSLFFNYFIKKLTSVPKNRKLVKDVDVKSYKGIFVDFKIWTSIPLKGDV